MSDAANDDFNSKVVVLAERFGGSKPPGPPLQPPGGGGTFDGMEARIASLEANVGHLQSDISEIKTSAKDSEKSLSDLKVEFATLNERVKHLPTKSYIGWWISAGLATAVGVLTLMSRVGWLVAGAVKS